MTQGTHRQGGAVMLTGGCSKRPATIRRFHAQGRAPAWKRCPALRDQKASAALPRTRHQPPTASVVPGWRARNLSRGAKSRPSRPGRKTGSSRPLPQNTGRGHRSHPAKFRNEAWAHRPVGRSATSPQGTFLAQRPMAAFPGTESGGCGNNKPRHPAPIGTSRTSGSGT